MTSAAGTRTSTSSGHTLGDDWLSCAKSAMALVISSLTEAPFGPALESIEDFRCELNAVEALLMAQRRRAGFSDTSTEAIIKKSGKVSKGEAKKRTKRSSAIDKNPDLANKMSKGEISTEQVDLLADASEKTDGEAAVDPEFINDIAGANPDQGKNIVRDYVDAHTSQDSRDSRYDRQRRRRKAYKGRSANGLSSLIIEGDDESVDAVLLNLTKNADRMYRQDGGRDLANGEHPRTHNQRMFDAAVTLLTGSTEPAANTGSDTTAEPAPAPAPTPPANRPGERPVMVFRSDISDITNDPDLLAEWTTELVGSGLVPSSLASYYRCISEHVAQLIDGEGAVLWQGRATRRVSKDQWIALVARDRSCVDCGAHHTRCEAHHLTPWNAPAKGKTDIDKLVLVCVDCHHRLHAANLTLEWDTLLGKWLKRPATWAETPGSGPPPRPNARRPAKSGARTSRARPDSRTAPNTSSTQSPSEAERAFAKW